MGRVYEIIKDLENESADIGINIRNEKDFKWADLVIDGKKYYETRNSNSLKPYIGKRVAIIRTGQGQAVAIGEVTIGEPLRVTDPNEFKKLEKQHLVPDTSKFKFGKEKWLYPMINPKRYATEKAITQKGAPNKYIARYLK